MSFVAVTETDDYQPKVPCSRQRGISSEMCKVNVTKLMRLTENEQRLGRLASEGRDLFFGAKVVD